MQRVAGAEGLGIDGKHTRLARAQLRIKVDTNGHALDFAHAAGQLLQFFVKLGVVVALHQLLDGGGKRGERRAFQLDAVTAKSFVKNVNACDVEFNLGHACQVVGGVAAVSLQTAQLHNIKQHRN